MRTFTTSTSPASVALLTNPTFTACVNSYATVCQQVPAVRTFDSSLSQRASNLFRECQQSHQSHQSRDSFNDHRSRDPVNDHHRDRSGPRNFNNHHRDPSGPRNHGNASVDIFTAVCKFLAELSNDVVTFIFSRKELLKSNEIEDLVDLYYESTSRTLDLFSTVENCVRNAESSQRLIRVAIQRFERESMGTDVGGNNRYAGTLEELNRVKAMGDPFGDEFATQYQAVYDEHVNLLDRLREMQEELDKNQSHVQETRTRVVGSVVVGSVIFAATLFTTLALSMFSFGLASPLVAATVLGGLAACAGAGAGAGIWVNVMLTDYNSAMERHKDLVSLTKNRTKLNIEEMRTIKNQVRTLITKILSIRDPVEVAVEGREEDVRLMMQEIIQKVEGLAEIIRDLDANVATCRERVVSGKARVLALMDQLH